MANLYVRSQQAGQSTPGNGSYRGVWQASQTWAVGDRCVPTSTTSFYVHECTTGGAGGGSEPSWSTTPGNTTNDSSAVWTCRNPTSWANATITLARAAAGDAAGDFVYVRSDHSENGTSFAALNWAGTSASPTRILCVSDSNEPPTTLATGALVKTTGDVNLQIVSTGAVYIYGIEFQCGATSSAANAISVVSQLGVTLDSCTLYMASTGSSSTISTSTTNSGVSAVYRNCVFRFSAAGQKIYDGGTGSRNRFIGCSFHASTTQIDTLHSSAVAVGAIFSGCDWSAGKAAMNCSSDSAVYSVEVDFVNCKMPGSWSGSVNSSTPLVGCVYTLVNSDSADTNYRLQRKTKFGEVTHETTLKRTGGASDGTTGIAWKMVSNADAGWSHQTLDTPEIVKWNETTGSSITVTVEFLRDSATNLTDKEIWLEVMYLGTSGYPLGSFITDAAANYLASGADQTTSSETWTTTGMSNPNKQKLSVTFTPQEKGFIHAVVKLAKASTTVYVDPVLTVS